jgi:hypothetical protein
VPHAAEGREESQARTSVQEGLEVDQERGRYKGRQKEVAARIVNKTRRQKGETKSRRRKSSGRRMRRAA